MEDNETVTIEVNKTSLKRDLSKLVLVAVTGFAAERLAGIAFDKITNRNSDAPTIEIDSE